MSALVSIVMPAYNCEQYIDEAINSILNQTYTNFELLICDDVSTDNTLARIQSYNDQRIQVFKNETNLGYPKTCNKLFSKAKGDYLTFLDADDYADLQRIETMVNAFNEDPELGMLGTAYLEVDEQGNKLKEQLAPFTEDKDLKANIYTKHLICGATIMITKKVYEDIGGYHEYYLNRISFQDYYWAALICLKYKSRILNTPLYIRRMHPQSISGSSKKAKIWYGYHSTLILLNQRKLTGTDDLEQNKQRHLKSKVYLKIASLFLSETDYQNALKYISKAIKFNPFSLYNYRTMFYIIRKRAS